jgi:cytochrome oxidase assembly protein ShyY1
MKPVEIKGIFDHNREMQVEKERNGEKGVDIVTPFYTHLDSQGKEQAIIVNRGWVPWDLRNQRLHYGADTMGTISGVLYRGDVETKYSKSNNPTIGQYLNVRPYDSSLIMQMPNQEEASQMMLHMIDFREDRRQVLPTVPSVNELSSFVISPSRHASYEMMWRMMAFSGVAANTALWLYF